MYKPSNSLGLGLGLAFLFYFGFCPLVRPFVCGTDGGAEERDERQDSAGHAHLGVQLRPHPFEVRRVLHGVSQIIFIQRGHNKKSPGGEDNVPSPGNLKFTTGAKR